MLEIEKAEGLYMYQKNGKELMDLISGIGVSTIGHRHPGVVQAIKDQVDRHLHLMVYGEFISSPQVKLAKALSDTLPNQLNNVFLVNSGSEATEGAIKLAKRHTGKTEIISFQNAYHGSTAGALSVCGNEDLKNSFRPLIPGNKILRFGNIEDLSQISENTAAVIIEPVQGEGGIRTASSEYFQELRKICNQQGALLIFDEIQTGYGRTGKFWAFEHFGIVPDILLCAKGMGGGMPIGAFISSKEIMYSLTHNPILGHITTFGGHPVSCVAALETLNIILDENLMEGVAEKEALFHNLLQHDRIKEIRSKGLMIAVEFESFEVLEKIIKNLLDLGVLSDWFLFCDNSMRIAPPLIISNEEIKKACNKILQAIDLSYQ
ncbi:aspartate aminotransferase family protein [Reichenbachiella sp. MALMAid0571]|uniref:aspartate aminotransferase family protein n=1 Tax=Reichenbachiella sp. MALMAid0571 TaxID=3143939 RepID=UPI0032DFD40D